MLSEMARLFVCLVTVVFAMCCRRFDSEVEWTMYSVCELQPQTRPLYKTLSKIMRCSSMTSLSVGMCTFFQGVSQKQNVCPVQDLRKVF